VLPTTVGGLTAACGLAAAVDVVLAAGIFVSMFALGAVVPIDLRALAASTLGAYAVIAVIEGVITALVVRALLGVRPDLVRVAEPLRRRRATALAPRGEAASPPPAVASGAGRPRGGTPWA
jgi:cobalt/nickel transport system permease protein